MSLNLEQKKAVVADIADVIVNAQAVVIAENRGLEVDGTTQLRKQAREAGVYLKVLKNTLARRAIQGTPFEQLSDELTGPLMYAISEDPVAGAKVLSAFAKNNDKLVIRGGSLANYVLDVNGVQSLAEMPSREEMLAKVVGTMQAPITKFVRTLNELPTSIVRVIAAVRDQKAA